MLVDLVMFFYENKINEMKNEKMFAGHDGVSYGTVFISITFNPGNFV